MFRKSRCVIFRTISKIHFSMDGLVTVGLCRKYPCCRSRDVDLLEHYPASIRRITSSSLDRTILLSSTIVTNVPLFPLPLIF